MNPAAPLAARSVESSELARRESIGHSIPDITRPASGALVVTLRSGELLTGNPWCPAVAAHFGAGHVKRLDAATWSVPRGRYGAVAWSLGYIYGGVRLTQHGKAEGGPGVCTYECWEANPDTVAECVCRCAGRHHGGGLDGSGMPDLVGAGEPNPTARPWMTAIWTPAGWHAHFGPKSPRPLTTTPLRAARARAAIGAPDGNY